MERTSTFQAYNGREVVMDILASSQIALVDETVTGLSPVEPSEKSTERLLMDRDVRSKSDSTPNIETSGDKVEGMSVTSVTTLPDNVYSNALEDFQNPTIPQSLYKVGDVVDVESRVWPGINKPGGIARVINVHSLPVEGDNANFFYSNVISRFSA